MIDNEEAPPYKLLAADTRLTSSFSRTFTLSALHETRRHQHHDCHEVSARRKISVGLYQGNRDNDQLLEMIELSKDAVK